MLIITLLIVSLIYALKQVVNNRLYSFETQESRDFWGLEWFNPTSSTREDGVKRDFVPHFCERISPEEFDLQRTVLTKREVRKLVNSDGY